MKLTLIIFGIFSFFIFFSFDVVSSRGKINTVVIDPGHGGRDPGALGSKSKEKDIVLNIGLKLGQYIKENLPDVNVFYTRETDEFVELFRRAEIANENDADLFISIHCNASKSSSTYGTETYVMGDHRREANLEVAKRENAAILYEEDYEDTYGGYDPHSPESHIIFNLYQNAYLENSLGIASLVQNQFKERAKRVNRGVKRAGFLVLHQVAMPGILVEAGFLSNPKEEEFLMSETGQSYIASAIYRAFRNYKEEHERLYEARRNNFKNDEISKKPEIAKSKEKQSKNNNGNDLTADISSSLSQEKNDPENQFDDICFRVQIATSSEEKPLDASEFEFLQNVDYYYHEGLYKYTVGKERKLEDAVKIKEEMQQSGFKDAFVVAFLNNERISPSEAIEILRIVNGNSP